MKKSFIFSLLCLLILALSPLPAQAYIGPGVAVAFLGYVFGPIAAIAVALGLVLFWPARWLYKKFKAKQTPADDTPQA